MIARYPDARLPTEHLVEMIAARQGMASDLRIAHL
jgi:hypothetical protein